jgi:Spy/CpxP family protein refolding chaperone
MTTPIETAAPPAFRRRLFNRQTAIAFIAGAAIAGGIGAAAWGDAMGGFHHGMMMDGTHSAAEISDHVDHMLKHLYVEIDASDAQKAQIGPLVKQAVADLQPLHAQLAAAHTHAMQALTQNSIDRTSLEAARVEHLQLADQASKRFTQLIADVGEVLTPAQRKALGDHLAKMHASMQAQGPHS